MHIKVPSFFLSFLLPRHSSSFIDDSIGQLRCRATTGSSFRGLKTTPSRCSICRPSSNCTTLQMHIRYHHSFFPFFYPATHHSFIGSVLSVAVSSNNRFIVSGSGTSPSRCSICRPSSNCTTLQMHIPVPSFFLSFLLPHHSSSFIDAYVRSVAVSSDNRFIVSGSDDKSIKVFDLQTKQQLHHFADAHTSTIILSFLSSTPPLILFHRHSKVSCGVERQQVHRFGVFRQLHQGVRSADQAATAPLCRCTSRYHHSFFPFFYPATHPLS